jgi:hypothetical protein
VYRECRHNEIERTLGAHADKNVWPDTKAQQVASELVCALVQLAKGQTRVLEDNSFGVGPPGRLCLDGVVDASLQAVDVGRVPINEQLTTFCRAQNRQQFNAQAGVRTHRFEHRLQVAEHLDPRRVEQRGVFIQA